MAICYHCVLDARTQGFLHIFVWGTYYRPCFLRENRPFLTFTHVSGECNWLLAIWACPRAMVAEIFRKCPEYFLRVPRILRIGSINMPKTAKRCPEVSKWPNGHFGHSGHLIRWPIWPCRKAMVPIGHEQK